MKEIRYHVDKVGQHTLLFVELDLTMDQRAKCASALDAMYNSRKPFQMPHARNWEDEHILAVDMLLYHRALVLNSEFIDLSFDGSQFEHAYDVADIIGDENMRIFSAAAETLVKGDIITMFHIVNVKLLVREHGPHEEIVQVDVPDDGNGNLSTVDFINLCMKHFHCGARVLSYEEAGTYAGSEDRSLIFLEGNTTDYLGVAAL